MLSDVILNLIYAERHIFSFMLSVNIMNVFQLTVIMQNVVAPLWSLAVDSSAAEY
jgi:hypothetical protein